MYPILGEMLSTFSSSIYISPLDFFSKPAIIERSVDLPQPLGPIIEINSPSDTSKLTFSNAKISFFLL